MVSELLLVLVSRAGLTSSFSPWGNEFQTSVPKKRHIQWCLCVSWPVLKLSLCLYSRPTYHSILNYGSDKASGIFKIGFDVSLYGGNGKGLALNNDV